jgi:hypothetical protein
VKECAAMVTRGNEDAGVIGVKSTELVCMYVCMYLCIIRIIEPRRMRWAGHVARMGEKRNV